MSSLVAVYAAVAQTEKKVRMRRSNSNGFSIEKP